MAARSAPRAKGGIMGKWSINVLLGSVLVLASVSAVRAADVQVIAGVGMADPLDEIAGLFERASGHKVVLRYGTASELIRMATSDVPFDLGVVPEDVWKDAAARARVAPGPMPDVARVGLGVAVRAGAPRTDISTAEALKQTLLKAHSIAWMPASASGAQLAGIYERLGITNEIKAKTKAQSTPKQMIEAVANGDAELAVSVLNVLVTPRLDIVGPLPAELQREMAYALGVAANSKEPEAAKAFAAYLMSPSAIAVIKAKGMIPGN